MSLMEELKRRNVIRVAVAYLVGSWLLLQVIDIVGPILNLPESFVRYLLFLLVIGLIPAVVFAWAFELTPEGVKRESDIDHTHSITQKTGRKLDRAIMITLALAVGFLLFDKLALQEDSGSTALEPEDSAQMDAAPVQGDTATQPYIQRSVAVLPFVAMSNGPDDDYFSDGLTEEIINALAQLPQLLVTARTSAFHFKGQNLPVDEIASQLGVAHVVEGSVRRAGDQLRITAQLIRAGDGFHLWSETYDRRTADTFAVQSDIAEKVASALNVMLDDRQRQLMQNAGTRNTEAFISFQKGVELFERAHLGSNQISLLRQANAEFERAWTLEPGMVQAYTHHTDLANHVLISRAAGELDGDITETDVAQAPEQLAYDFSQSIKYAKNRGQRFNSQFDFALMTGHWKGLRQLKQRALTAPGCDTPIWVHLAGPAFGAAALTLGALQRMGACDPLRVRPLVHITGSLLWLGQPVKAEQFARDSLKKTEHPGVVRGLALALAAQGKFEEAQTVAGNWLKPGPDLSLTHSMLAAMNADSSKASLARDRYLAEYGPNDRDSLVMEAAMGNRNEANRLAAQIDARPSGSIALLQAIYACMCGAPFELEATPVFAQNLDESGLRWPPINPIGFPLKDW